MRVCLVRPPTFLSARTYPLNLGHLAGALTAAGHQVSLVDGELIARQLLEDRLGKHNLSKLLAKLFVKQYLHAAEDLVAGFFAGDATLWDTIIERILACRPELLGFSCYTASMSATRVLTSRLKERYHLKVPIVLGGSHPTALPVETLSQLPGADLVVVGEGEETLTELAAAVANREDAAGVRGLAFRQNGQVVLTPPRPQLADLGALPPTHLELGEGVYADYVLQTSRGCPFSCKFCASRVIWGRQVRFRPPAQVAQEAAFLREKRGIKTIRLGDDTLTLNLDHLKGLRDAFKAAGLREVSFSVGSRIDTLNAAKLAVLKEMGVSHISFGVETGSPRIMHDIDKHLNLDRVIPTLKMVQDAGIFTKTFFIINHPGETRADLEATHRLIKKITGACRLNMVELNTGFPYPGTAWWTYCQERRLLSGINIYDQSHKYNHQQRPAVNMTREPLAIVEKMRRRINRTEMMGNMWAGAKKLLNLLRTDPQGLRRRYCRAVPHGPLAHP